MHRHRFAALVGLAFAAASPGTLAEPARATDPLSSSGLVEVAAFAADRPTGTTVSKTGRLFVTLPYAQYSDDRHAASVVEVMPDGAIKPYPDEGWNVPAVDMATALREPGRHFLCVQGAWVDGQDRLWVLDSGSPKRARVVPGGAKLVQVDLATDRVARVIPFDAALLAKETYLNDVRVDPARGFAYVSDTGTPGIVVVDLGTGRQRRIATDWVRVEERGPAVEGVEAPAGMRGRFPRSVDGVAIDQARDLVYFGTQPWLGRSLYRVRGAILRDFAATPSEIARQVAVVATPAFMDGIEMAPDGSGAVLVTDVERGAVLRVEPDQGGRASVVVEDPRLKWPDTVGATPGGRWLYIPVAQFHTLASLNGGVDRREAPFRVYRYEMARE